MEATLLTEYKSKVVPALKEKLGCTNVHQVPSIEKIVVNCGFGSQGDPAARKQATEDVIDVICQITGQKPVLTLAKKSISNFRLREGDVVGAKVTLRGRTMYDFLLRLVKTAIPVIRDFRGVSPKCFDGRGNYTLGISDQTIFPEVELDKVKRNLGFDICIVTTATTDEAALQLLTELGMPFRKPKKQEEESAA